MADHHDGGRGGQPRAPTNDELRRGAVTRSSGFSIGLYAGRSRSRLLVAGSATLQKWRAAADVVRGVRFHPARGRHRCSGSAVCLGPALDQDRVGALAPGVRLLSNDRRFLMRPERLGVATADGPGLREPRAVARERRLGCDPARDQSKPDVQFGPLEELTVALLPGAVLKVASQAGERCFDGRGGEVIPR